MWCLLKRVGASQGGAYNTTTSGQSRPSGNLRNLAIDRGHLRHLTLEAEARFDTRAAGATHSQPLVSGVEQLRYGSCELRGVNRHQATRVRSEHFGARADIGGHNGARQSHGLEDRPTKTLGLGARKYEHVGGGEYPGDVCAEPGDVDALS